MTSRNLTEVFIIMRNNACKNRKHYVDSKANSDGERLLRSSMHSAEGGLELQDDYGTPPVWMDKLEEAQYTMSKIKPKLDELGSLHARHLLRPAFDEHIEEEKAIEILSQEIAKLITSTHRHIQCIRSSLNIGSKCEQRLTSNAVICLLLQLQELSTKFRCSQNGYLHQLSSREERSQKYFENDKFTNIELGGVVLSERSNFVDTFDNFLQPPLLLKSAEVASQPAAIFATSTKVPNNNNTYLHTYGNNEEESQQAEIDAHFQKPIANRLSKQQLLLFEEENSRLAHHRDAEVTKIIKSIYDLHDIFKDLGQMVQEQGTVMDRIDYNVEQTQTRVYEGLRQLQRSEYYQRKNRKMCIIIVLAAVTLVLLLLLIATKL